MTSVETSSLAHSRDPAGVDPFGADSHVGADPAGFPPAEAEPPLPTLLHDNVPPPTPRRVNDNRISKHDPSPVMAFLVGKPPSPPPRTRGFDQSPGMAFLVGKPPSPPKSAPPSRVIHSAPPSDQSYARPFSVIDSNNTMGYLPQTGSSHSLQRVVSGGSEIHVNQRDGKADLPRPSIRGGQVVENTRLLQERENEKPTPVSMLASPRSAATEQHSNKRSVARQSKSYSKRLSFDREHEQIPSDNDGYTGVHHARATTSQNQRSLQNTNQTEKKAKGFNQSAKIGSDGKEKRGFFGKLFRAKKKTTIRSDASVKSSGSSSSTEKSIQVSADSSSSAQKRLEHERGVIAQRSQREQPRTSEPKRVLVVPPRERERTIERPAQAPPKSTIDHQGITSRPSLDHGEGLESVASTITPDLDSHRRDVFFAHDEVSTITAPTFGSGSRRSMDPQETATLHSGVSSDPLGHYWNKKGKESEVDRSSASQGTSVESNKEPDGEYLLKSNERTKLHQSHAGTMKDPVGESSRRNEKRNPGSHSSLAGSASPRSKVHNPSLAELRPEPSAYRNGSPYTLDPPLPNHEDDGAQPPSLEETLRKNALREERRKKSLGSVVVPLSKEEEYAMSPRTRSIAMRSHSSVTSRSISIGSNGKSAKSADTRPLRSPTVASVASEVSKDLHSTDSADEELEELARNRGALVPGTIGNIVPATTGLGMAALLNAQAVAYLHTLSGTPSPRHNWGSANLSDDEQNSPVSKVVKDLKHMVSKQGAFVEYATPEGTSKEEPFSPQTKFQRRRQFGAHSPRSRALARKKEDMLAQLHRARSVEIKAKVLSFGLDARRQKRFEDIALGRVTPVILIKKKKKPKAEIPSPRDDELDPIQRAGRRLLSKAAIPIQTMVRRYLAQRESVNRMWALVTIQARFRCWRCVAYLSAYRLLSTRIQGGIRGYQVRRVLSEQHYGATQIQRIVRGYIATVHLHDCVFWITKIQSGVRTLLAKQRVKRLKQRERAALCLQCAVRQLHARYVLEQKQMVRFNEAAITIQAMWRGFQGYTDYIFALVDILVLQRTIRRWLAIKRVDRLREQRSAIRIQSSWRCYTARIAMLYDLVHIVIAQSVVRRFLTKSRVTSLRRVRDEREEEFRIHTNACTKIQAAWRGFWSYSHYIIVQYEVIRIQTMIRGKLARSEYSLKLGCSIMIQAAVRCCLQKRTLARLKVAKAVRLSKAERMRENLSAARIQFWWRVVMECAKEKEAALIIERFFLRVRAEVDKELRFQKEKAEVKILDGIWNKTVSNVDNLLGRVQCSPMNTSPARGVAKSARDAARGATRKVVPDGGRKAPEGTRQSDDHDVQPPAEVGVRSMSAPRLRPNPSYVSDDSSSTDSRGLNVDPATSMKRNVAGSLADFSTMNFSEQSKKIAQDLADLSQLSGISKQERSRARERKSRERRGHSLGSAKAERRSYARDSRPTDSVDLSITDDNKSDVSNITSSPTLRSRRQRKSREANRDSRDDMDVGQEISIDDLLEAHMKEHSGKLSSTRNYRSNGLPSSQHDPSKHFFGDESETPMSRYRKPPKSRRSGGTPGEGEASLRRMNRHGLPTPSVDKYGADKYARKASPRYSTKIMVVKGLTESDTQQKEFDKEGVEVEYVDGEEMFGEV